MNKMGQYTISRVGVSAVFGVLFWLLGGNWQSGVLMGVLSMVYFLWAPFSGRYAVDKTAGVTALRRDERSAAINEKASRNAFVALSLALGALLVYAEMRNLTSLPLDVLDWLLILGVVVYFLSDYLLRRRY